MKRVKGLQLIVGSLLIREDKEAIETMREVKAPVLSPECANKALQAALKLTVSTDNAAGVTLKSWISRQYERILLSTGGLMRMRMILCM